jgi:predicted metal-dependent phosphotriesterase family hydrolase
VRPLVCNPLLTRFFRGEDWRLRAVKISDSGRIRNELQTLCSEALEHFGENGVRLYFDRIGTDVIFPEQQAVLKEVLGWYKEHHPLWFSWLELA